MVCAGPCVPVLAPPPPPTPCPSNTESGAESSEDEGMGSSSSSELDSEGFSRDVSDRAWEKAQELCSLAVWQECNEEYS